GGLVFIVLEKRPVTMHCETVHDIGFGRAIAIGLFQCLAMIPGTSRSGATIIGGMAVGASRAAAAEFSFFLAIPTMLGATVYTLVKIGVAFTPVQWAAIVVGSVVSFGVAYGAIAFLMRLLKRHTFIPFGWYRIVLGAIVLAYFLVIR
ncbi:MAG: undecaprenyl-diphosphatase, partial [bacterium]|nr:undecaprenyl-diphosphatase [bacterium]